MSETKSIPRRKRQIFILAGCSGSSGIADLNIWGRDSAVELRRLAAKYHWVDFSISVIKFSNGTGWHGEKDQPPELFKWLDFSGTNAILEIGLALKIVGEQLKSPPPNIRMFPPLILIITNGAANDDFDKGLEMLMDSLWGERSVKIAVAIGEGSDLIALRKFTHDLENQVFESPDAGSWTTFLRLEPCRLPLAPFVNQEIPLDFVDSDLNNNSDW